MTPTLYGSLQSTCTQRVILVLLELGVPYEFSHIVLQNGEHKVWTENIAFYFLVGNAPIGKHADLDETAIQEPAFVKDYHPFGLLPVLDDNDVRIFESRAICRYLVAKHGGSDSILATGLDGAPAEIGRFEQALSVEYSNFDPAMKTLSYELLFKG
ncbi:hypothetical protein MKZ38_004637 [Zalerion maritima]|uniref:glutathione transferase n=1 Tax=Zalerion maritima TaxID=339359 RepID=A0AAD5WPG0_9PEZI|nr:hypothetical protein MKZ38_004637 [Zalerion maritima]